MCLIKVYPTQKEVDFNEGYKLFYRVEPCKDHTHSIAFKYYGMKKFPYGTLPKRRWLYAEVPNMSPLRDSNGEPYRTGFHIWESLEDAKVNAIPHSALSVAIHRVLFKNVVAVGRQNITNKGLTVVARKMYVMEEVKYYD